MDKHDTKLKNVSKPTSGKRRKGKNGRKNSKTRNGEDKNTSTNTKQEETEIKSDCDVTIEKDARQTQCDICGKSLSNKGALYKHLMVVHQKLKRYMCEVCGQSFGQHGDLKRHNITHTGEKLFKCEECGKMLSKGSCLKLHMRIHTGEKPYQCQVCSKFFAIHGDLKRHARIHSGERQYTCTLCSRAFGRKEHLSAHYVTHSRTENASRFTCQFCAEVYCDKNALRKHYVKHIGAAKTVISGAGNEHEKSNSMMQISDGNPAEKSGPSLMDRNSPDRVTQTPVGAATTVISNSGNPNEKSNPIMQNCDSGLDTSKLDSALSSEYVNELRLVDTSNTEQGITVEIPKMRPCFDFSSAQYEQSSDIISHTQHTRQNSLNHQSLEISQICISQNAVEKTQGVVSETQENMLGHSENIFMQEYASLIEAAKNCLRTDVDIPVVPHPLSTSTTAANNDRASVDIPTSDFVSGTQRCLYNGQNEACTVSDDTDVSMVTNVLGFNYVPTRISLLHVSPESGSHFSNNTENKTATEVIFSSVPASSSQLSHENRHLSDVEAPNTREIVHIEPLDKSGVVDPLVSESVSHDSNALSQAQNTFVSTESASMGFKNSEPDIKLNFEIPSKRTFDQSDNEKDSNFILLSISNDNQDSICDENSDTLDLYGLNDDTDDDNERKETEVSHVESELDRDSANEKSAKQKEVTEDKNVTDDKSSNDTDIIKIVCMKIVNNNDVKHNHVISQHRKRKRSHSENSTTKKKKRKKSKKEKGNDKRKRKRTRAIDDSKTEKDTYYTDIKKYTDDSYIKKDIDDSEIKNNTKSSKIKKVSGSPKNKKEKKERKDCICDICGLRFRFLAQCKKHQLSHTGEKPHECPHCHKAYALKGDLKLHIETHSAERLHMCELCGNSYKWAKSLKIHKQTHAVFKPHKCDTCSLAFFLKADLARHCKGHLGVKPHTCKICQKSFSRKEHLKTHSFIHLDSKPNKCNYCDKSFAQKVSLQKHMCACYGREVKQIGPGTGGHSLANLGNHAGYNMLDLLNNC